MQKEYFSTTEVAKILGISTVAVWKKIKEGKLKADRFGRNFMIPKIVQKASGVSPIITLLALAIGGKLAGVPGVIISVPVVITLQVLAKRYIFPKD